MSLRFLRAVQITVVVLMCALARPSWCAHWVEGQNYFLIQPAQPTGLPAGKIQVVEIFSYACPGCNRFYPYIDKLSASLPSNAVMEFLPASFRPDEDWPMFQRAYLAADQLKVARRAHDAMFDAVWKTGELAVWDARLNREKRPPPALADAARFYQRAAGIKPDTFLATAAAFGIDVKVKQADERIRAYGVAETPSLVVNGKYRLNPVTAGGDEETIALVKWLVARESTPKAGAEH
jgi:thiol:disulfide interchange protein DsbA